MTELKRHHPQTTLSALWDRVLLAQYFELEVDLPPEQASQYLLTLSQPQQGFFNPSKRSVSVEQVDTATYKFQIHTVRYGRGMSYDSAKIVGTVASDGSTGKTIVSGKTTVGILFIFIMIACIGFVLPVGSSVATQNLGWVIIVSLFFAFYFTIFVRDRYDLSMLIKEASFIEE